MGKQVAAVRLQPPLTKVLQQTLKTLFSLHMFVFSNGSRDKSYLNCFCPSLRFVEIGKYESWVEKYTFFSDKAGLMGHPIKFIVN